MGRGLDLKKMLNVGSGKDPQPVEEGWINLDVQNVPGVDMVCDMMDASFPDEAFTSILAKDVIDHVPFIQGRVLLGRFYRWLMQGGTLLIHTPNLRFLAMQLAKGDDHEAVKWLYASDGQGSTYYPSNVTRWAYSRESLTKTLEAIGFKVTASDVDCMGYGLTVMAMKPRAEEPVLDTPMQEMAGDV